MTFKEGYVAALRRIMGSAVAGLCVGSFIATAALVLASVALEPFTSERWEGALVVLFWGTLTGGVFGAAFMALYGLPAYAALEWRGLANPLTAAAAGVIPGGLVYLSGQESASYYLAGYGLSIALATHYLAKKSART